VWRPGRNRELKRCRCFREGNRLEKASLFIGNPYFSPAYPNLCAVGLNHQVKTLVLRRPDFARRQILGRLGCPLMMHLIREAMGLQRATHAARVIEEWERSRSVQACLR
jgi:hypothetical protein